MRVIRQPLGSAEVLGPSIVTIGNFDGVHRAHQELFRAVVEAARAGGVASVGLSFEPHPAQILAPSRAPQILTPTDLKIRLIAEQSVDVLWILPFTARVAQLSPGEFVERALLRTLRAREVHVGANFCFGRNRQGTVEALLSLGRAHGFAVRILPVMTIRGQPVSSSRIRALLAEGRITMANRLLGRAYVLEGRVEAGEGRGRGLTVPTLNLGGVQQQLPKTGVYATTTAVNGRRFESVTNVGYKPTFGPHGLSVESHLLEFSGDVEADRMEVQFHYRLREEMKFPHPDALKAQIGMDVRRAIRYFRLRRSLRSGKGRGVARFGGER